MELTVWLWVGILVVFIVMEAMTAQLVALWFIAGAVVGFVTALLHGPVWLQMTLFVIVSVVSLFLLRPLIHQKVTPRIVATNADMSVGRIAVVSERIENDLARGRAMLEGQDWAARSYDGRILEKGERVRVLSIDGVKLIVLKEDN